MGSSSSAISKPKQNHPQNNYESHSKTRNNFEEIPAGNSIKREDDKPLSHETVAIASEETENNTNGIDKRTKAREIQKRLIEKYDKEKMTPGRVKYFRKVLREMQVNFKIEGLHDAEEDDRQTLATLQREKSLYLNRLSEAAGARLRFNNPNIANLSDTNRPTKLAERMSELYDNEWTDAFDTTLSFKGKKPTEKEIAVCLRDILKFCYDNCKKEAGFQRKIILQALRLGHQESSSQTTPPDKTTPSSPTTPPGLGLLVEEFQKASSTTVLDGLLKKIKNNLLTTKSFQLVIRNNKVYQTPVGKFVEQCISLSWHTQIHSPPVVMDFSEKADRSNYRAYTCSGPYFDYLLWPVLRLDEGGPVMTKGIAQYKLKK